MSAIISGSLYLCLSQADFADQSDALVVGRLDGRPVLALMDAWSKFTPSARLRAISRAPGEFFLVMTYVDADTAPSTQSLYDWATISVEAAEAFCQEHFADPLSILIEQAWMEPQFIDLPGVA